MASVVTPPTANTHLPTTPPQKPRYESTQGQHSMSSNNRITYAKSWANDVQNYHAAKSVLPWLSEQQKPIKYVTRYEKSREEREYDIVLGRFREEDKERGYQQREGDQLKRTLEHGQAKQLRAIQRFHMINNAPMYPGAKDPTEKCPQQHPNRTKNAATFNIVTNIPHSGESASTPTTSVSPTRKPYREFNILTNKYHDRHEGRFEQEAAQAKRLAAQKYFKTRTFDPLRVTYVDEDREKEFLSRRHQEQQKHGKDRVLSLPPREQFSEGRLYNILNQQIINPEKLVTLIEKEQRALNKMQKTAYEKKMREVGEIQQARETELCLNRYAHERHVESQVHGYDVLSNQSYTGKDAKTSVYPRTHAALPPWKTIKTGLLMKNRVLPRTSTATDTVANTRATRDDDSKKMPNILDIDHTTPVQTPTSVVRTGGFHAD